MEERQPDNQHGGHLHLKKQLSSFRPRAGAESETQLLGRPLCIDKRRWLKAAEVFAEFDKSARGRLNAHDVARLMHFW